MGLEGSQGVHGGMRLKRALGFLKGGHLGGSLQLIFKGGELVFQGLCRLATIGEGMGEAKGERMDIG